MHMQYESSTSSGLKVMAKVSSGLKVMAKVKVFVYAANRNADNDDTPTLGLWRKLPGHSFWLAQKVKIF